MAIVALAGACAFAFAAGEAAASGTFPDSPHREPVARPACDVVFTTANFASERPHLRDPDTRVLCVTPGDYRSHGELWLRESGTPSAPRQLRLHVSDGLDNAVQRSQRAIFESIKITASWWVVEQLTIQPLDPATAWFVSILGGDHNVLDGNLIDGVQHANPAAHSAVVIGALSGDPALFNSVQANVVRNGNKSRRPVDYFGVLVRPGFVPGEDNDFNKVVDNEIADWGDGIALGGVSPDCSEPGVQHGTVIDGNDVYLTSAKRIDCATGATNANGDCACAENAIDIKAAPGPAPEQWTQITNNRVWGFRPTSKTVACGGSGSNGQAITGGSCARHALVANNAVADSTTGINPAGASWIIAGNLLHGIRAPAGWQFGSLAINASPLATDLDIQFNTLVGVDSAYDDASSNTDTRCNVVIQNGGILGPGQPRGANHSTRYNYLYQSPTTNFVGSSNPLYATAAASRDGTYCYWRRRWTSPELVCVPLASTTSASPHAAAAAVCLPGLAASFGIARISWVTAQPCDDGVDNDGDGRSDAPADPGCAGASSEREDPVCQNGVDDDGDGNMDFDGGASTHGGTWVTARDPQCASPGDHEGACGLLGVEIAAVLPWLVRRRRRMARGLR